MNTRQKGDYSELVVLAELVGQERRVAVPYGQSEGFDMLVEGRSGKWSKIQVKTAYRRGLRSNRIYLDTIRGTSLNKKRGYTEGAFDFLIGVLPVERLFWVVPFARMRSRRCITLDEHESANWGMLD